MAEKITGVAQKLTRKDFISTQDVRWCPGCGDYAILSAVQKSLADLGEPRENYVFVSGIGCSSRLPYYVNTYGFHSIHGRAPTLATGVKAFNPDLSVWVITGDGDGLSIGGNHFLHALRRNIDINILLFNNRIYGLTKGQYSPTSEIGKKTKSTPVGSVDYPINPVSFAIGAEGTFIARTVDTDMKHLGDILLRSGKHKGASCIEIFQNCVIFNDKTFSKVTDRENRSDAILFLEHGKPLIFGKERNKGIRLNGLTPEVVTIGKNGMTEKDLIVHDEKNPDPTYAFMLSRMGLPNFPVPMGIFRAIEKPTYEDLLEDQVTSQIKSQGRGKLETLLHSGDIWEVS